MSRNSSTELGMEKNYHNDDFSQPIELEVGWEAIQGVNPDYGIVDIDDDEYDPVEEELGLMNDHFGVSVLPTDSVTPELWLQFVWFIS